MTRRNGVVSASSDRFRAVARAAFQHRDNQAASLGRSGSSMGISVNDRLEDGSRVG